MTTGLAVICKSTIVFAGNGDYTRTVISGTVRIVPDVQFNVFDPGPWYRLTATQRILVADAVQQARRGLWEPWQQPGNHQQEFHQGFQINE